MYHGIERDSGNGGGTAVMTFGFLFPPKTIEVNEDARGRILTLEQDHREEGSETSAHSSVLECVTQTQIRLHAGKSGKWLRVGEKDVSNVLSNTVWVV